MKNDDINVDLYESLQRMNRMNRIFRFSTIGIFIILIITLIFTAYILYSEYNLKLSRLNEKYISQTRSIQNDINQYKDSLDVLNNLLKEQIINLDAINGQNIENFDAFSSELENVGRELNKLWGVSLAKNSKDIEQIKQDFKQYVSNNSQSIAQVKSSYTELSENLNQHIESFKNFKTSSNAPWLENNIKIESILKTVDRLETKDQEINVSLTNQIKTLESKIKSVSDLQTIMKNTLQNLSDIQQNNNSQSPGASN